MNSEKLNALNFGEYDLPEGYYDYFEQLNQHLLKKTGSGLTIILSSRRYWGHDGNYLFMLCFAYGDGRWVTKPINWANRHALIPMDQCIKNFDDYESAKNYILQFQDVDSYDAYKAIEELYASNKNLLN